MTGKFTELEPTRFTILPVKSRFDNIFRIARCSENQIAVLEEDLDKSPDKKPAINKLIDRAIPK